MSHVQQSALRLPQLVELYLRGDPVNAWEGKFSLHAAGDSGHSEAVNHQYALKHMIETSIDLPADHPAATRRGAAASSRHLADLEANQLRPSDLRHVQQRLVSMGRARGYINGCVRRIVHFFDWCTQYEYMEAEVLTGLKTIKPLPEGKPGVNDPEPIRSPKADVLDRTLACASWLLRKAMELQAHGSMRPGELVQMRTCDIKVSKEEDGVCWYYHPPRHKTARKIGYRPPIYLNHAAQEIVREVVDYMYGQESQELLPGLAGLPGLPRGMPKIGDTSDTRRIFWRATGGPTGRAEGWRTTASYGKAIERASWRAGVKLRPNQLRKFGLNKAANRHGEETARQVAGHTDAKMTRDHYLDPETRERIEHEKARQYALEFDIPDDAPKERPGDRKA